MKRKVIIAIVLCIVLGGTIIMLKPPNVEEFDLIDYHMEVDNFPWDKNVGQIENAKDAIKKAKKAWTEKFNSLDGQYIRLYINIRPVKVYYDDTNDCWYLHGTTPKNMAGGAPNIIIKSNGDVLAIWYDQ